MFRTRVCLVILCLVVISDSCFFKNLDAIAASLSIASMQKVFVKEKIRFQRINIISPVVF